MRHLLLLMTVSLLLSAASALPAAEARSRPADAEESTASADFEYSPNWPEPPDTTGMLLRLGFGTVVTIGLCVGTMIFGRRWMQRLPAGGSARKLQIEESVTLGNRAVLYLVKIGETHLVAGTDAGGLKSLLVLPTAFQEVLDQQIEPTQGTRPTEAEGQSAGIALPFNAQRAA